MVRSAPFLFALSHLAFAPALAAQGTLALAAGANEAGPRAVVDRALLAAELKPAYAIHLVSDWPQLGEAGGGCINGGQEIIDGTLELTSGGNYIGHLQREATIHFCGPHGIATGACSLTLKSSGAVSADGEIRPVAAGWADPLIELHWATAPEGDAVKVSGDCTAAFNEALKRMYAGVTHILEFPLPVAGEGRRLERLEEGWIVEVQ